MNETHPKSTEDNPAEPAADTGGRSGDGRPLYWLLGQKVTVPERVAGYLDRPELVERALPTRRRLTVLLAPGGFGKTTLLAECCRRLRKDGIRTAWVSVDEQDEPAVLDTYIAYACQTAGAGAELEDLAMSDLGQLKVGMARLTEIALREIANLDAPFVLAFDELERLQNPEAVALLEFLLQRGPPNLHLAFTCRQLPAGVNVTGAVLEGRAEILSADDLRFSSSEVAEFFEWELTEERLAALLSESAGWPFAVRISRNEMAGGGQADAHISREFVENWVESRLFAGLGAEEREFLLDIGLFEWMDAALLDDVLERSDSMRAIRTMPVLAGLLEPVRDGVTDIWRLHPLIRDHCVRRRYRETPQRFRTVHRRIAGALARRGQTTAAMRHAVEAGEAALAGEIMERAGGARLLTREGLVQFQAAERLLSEEVVAARPRLGLARCLALILAGRMPEAMEHYLPLAALIGRLEDDADEADLALAAENCVVRGLFAMYSGERFGSVLIQTHLAEVARLAETPGLDVMTRGIMECSLCVASGMTARFRTALDHAPRARAYLRQSRHMTMFLDIQVGQIFMAQGRTKEAESTYRRAERGATELYGADSEPAAICEVLLRELALECGRVEPGLGVARIPGVLATGRSPVQAYAAASGAMLDRKLRDEGVESALESAGEVLDYVRSARLPALARYVTALRVSLLATAGRIVEAENAWKAENLPEQADGCLDLTGQSWREMEALSCARLRLMIGGERFGEGRGFAGQLRALAAARGLKRTLLRALALSAVLEVRAGEAATGHLEAYLRLYAEAPFAGPLVRERKDCAQALDALLNADRSLGSTAAARSLRAAMERAEPALRPALTAREREVLRRLEKDQDKQIGVELGLSAHGVRYHIRKLFAKLEVRKRSEAVQRAREIGLLPEKS